MQICHYCKTEAFYPPKTRWGNWCCQSRFYDCPGYKKKIKKVPWNKGLKGVQVPWSKGQIGTFTGKQHSEETKAKISSSMKGNRNANHRGDRQSFYKDIRMDSSWEVKTAKYLDEQNIHWIYGEKGFKLSDGRYYYPDFFIYEDDKFVKLVEVKGYFREQNRLKYELFKRDYSDIVIELWDQPVLKQLKII